MDIIIFMFFKGFNVGKFDKHVGSIGEEIIELLQYFSIIARNLSQKYGI